MSPVRPEEEGEGIGALDGMEGASDEDGEGPEEEREHQYPRRAFASTEWKGHAKSHFALGVYLEYPSS